MTLPAEYCSQFSHTFFHWVATSEPCSLVTVPSSKGCGQLLRLGQLVISFTTIQLYHWSDPLHKSVWKLMLFVVVKANTWHVPAKPVAVTCLSECIYTCIFVDFISFGSMKKTGSDNFLFSPSELLKRFFPSLEDIQQESIEGDTKDSNLCVHSPALRTSKERNVPPDKSQQFWKLFPFKTWKMGRKLQIFMELKVAYHCKRTI